LHYALICVILYQSQLSRMVPPMGHTQKIPDTELEHIKALHFEEGKSQAEIGRMYGVGSSSVSRFFKRHGLKGIPPGGRNAINPGEDALALDIDNGLTNRQIGKKYRASIQAVCNWMHQYGFDVNRDVFRYEQLLPPDTLRSLVDQGKNDREIARQFNIGFQAVHSLRKRHGIPSTTHKDNPGHDTLYKLYIVQRLNQKQLAKALGVTRYTATKWLAECDIRKRNRPEQIGLAIERGAWNGTAMKARHTQMRNRLLKGSEPQRAVLISLITTLEPLCAQGWEIIIGQQNWSILDGSAEVDIPIVALRADTILRVAVEVDGVYWHQDTAPLSNKDARLRNRGWTPFHFTAPAGTVKKMMPAIDAFTRCIHDYILTAMPP